MGCRHSKQAVVVKSQSPTFKFSVSIVNNGSLVLDSSLKKKAKASDDHKAIETSKLSSRSSSARFSVSFRLGSLRRSVEAEQAAAGWPSWLTTVASEAIHGLVPLPADNFVKLAKIGQGTYSSVFRARDIETGGIVALKKVRFDNVRQESIRFMAREIMILRRLDHPNIIKLEGIITSRLSSSIYLVFEYMEHDLSGLIYCPEIIFSVAQVKCYMKQLLSAIEHFHSKSIMHRDIKASNILLNNKGILKVADFGLANLYSSKHKHPLTSRVVTLWYRPPELLLGSTRYGVSIDLWSVGCVFAELLLRKPILKGRTEVEQLHKIMKLCGSPPDEFWKKAKLAYATMFKPHQPYASCLRERFRDFSVASVDLLETLLSVEPKKRGTASSALLSEYFQEEPFASCPSSLPKYPPKKEIDTRRQDESRRQYNDLEKSPTLTVSAKSRSINTSIKNSEQPTHLTHNFKDQKPTTQNLNHTSARSSNNKSRGPNIIRESKSTHTATSQEAWRWRQGYNKDISGYFGTKIGAGDSYKIDRHAILKLKQQFKTPESHQNSAMYHTQELTSTFQDYQGTTEEEESERFEFSGPMLSEWEHGGDEFLQRHDQQMRQALHKTQMRSSHKQQTVSTQKHHISSQLHYIN